MSGEMEFERSKSIDLTFPADRPASWEFTLEKPVAPTNTRFDLGIGRDDIKPVTGGLDVTVHSLGAVASPPARLVLEDATGREVARATIPPLAELKLVRALQAEVKQRNEEFNRQHPDPKKLTDKDRADRASIHRDQREVTELIEEMTQPPEAEGDKPADKQGDKP